MKILAFLILLFSLGVNCYSQNICWPDQSDSYWKIGPAFGSARLGDCSSITTYNCHGFTRAYFENNCRPTFGQYYGAYTCPNIKGELTGGDLRNSQQYVQICSSNDAEIALYDLINPVGDHSAVKINNVPLKYASKYGADGPLVSHDLNNSWYHINGKVTATNYWVYVGPIVGNTTVSGTTAVTFSVGNKPGVSYYWSLSNGNLSISGPPNQPTVTLVPLHSGTVTLYCQTSSACGVAKQQSVTITIQSNICLEGDFRVGVGPVLPMWTTNRITTGSVDGWFTCPGATNYSWSRTSGSITSWYSIGNHVYFTMPTNGSISFVISANGQSRNVTFYNSGYYRVYPTPADNFVKIDATQEQEFSVTVLSEKGVVKTIEKYFANEEIDVSDLPKGDYYLHLLQNGKSVYQQRFRKK
jgi:hypothetical protein